MTTMKGIGLVSAFLGGAIVGCATAMLFAPEKGSDLRSKIKDILLSLIHISEPTRPY